MWNGFGTALQDSDNNKRRSSKEAFDIRRRSTYIPRYPFDRKHGMGKVVPTRFISFIGGVTLPFAFIFEIRM